MATSSGKEQEKQRPQSCSAQKVDISEEGRRRMQPHPVQVCLPVCSLESQWCESVPRAKEAGVWCPRTMVTSSCSRRKELAHTAWLPPLLSFHLGFQSASWGLSSSGQGFIYHWPFLYIAVSCTYRLRKPVQHCVPSVNCLGISLSLIESIRLTIAETSI